MVLAAGVALTGLAAALQYRAQRRWEQVLEQEITRNLTQKAQMFSSRINADHMHSLAVIAAEEGRAAGARATIIDGVGKVVADSQNPVTAVEAEGRHPEFVAALHGVTGIERRRTNGVTVLYVAAPVPGGAARLAYPMSDLEIASDASREQLILTVIIELLAALLISALVIHLLPVG
jgi:two-component system phosphate regulon sensor histidine kinase PhoR